VGCCGQKRAALRVVASPSTPSPPPEREPELEPADRLVPGTVPVAYHGRAGAVLRRGPSGRLYTFSAARPARAVLADDAAALLHDPDFRLLPAR
jgi:hypothetical protein